MHYFAKAWQHYNIETLHHYNIIALQHYNTTELQHYNTTKLQHYSITSFATSQHYNITTIQHSNITTLQRHYNTTTWQLQHYNCSITTKNMWPNIRKILTLKAMGYDQLEQKAIELNILKFSNFMSLTFCHLTSAKWTLLPLLQSVYCSFVSM